MQKNSEYDSSLRKKAKTKPSVSKAVQVLVIPESCDEHILKFQLDERIHGRNDH